MAECTYVDSLTRSLKAFARSTPVYFTDASFNLQGLLRRSTSTEDEILTGMEEASGEEPCMENRLPLQPSGRIGGLKIRSAYSDPSDPPRTSTALSERDRAYEAKRPAEDEFMPSPTLHLPTKRRGDLSLGHWIRKRRRIEAYEEKGHVAKLRTVEKCILPSLPVEFNAFEVASLPATQGAYGAKVAKLSGSRKVGSLSEAKELGLKIHTWNGIDPEPFVDQDGRIFMVLAGRPRDETYVAAATKVFKLMEKERLSASFSKNETDHRRGKFPALNIGVTHGMGTLCPTSLDNASHSAMVDRILADASVQRLAGFASSSFSLWAPDVYNYYKQNLDKVFVKKPKLRRIFRRSIFPAGALNFGPHVCTEPHCDCKNCPFGMCAIQALGEFDPKEGGHLILWDLHMAVEFPPGSTILVPSATITHSNIPTGPDENRASFTQYCAGGLFRWVDYGFRTEKELRLDDPVLYQEICDLRPHRWKMGLDLLSTVKELKKQGGSKNNAP